MFGMQLDLAKLVTSFQPDRIFHLAAQSYPTVSLEQPRETLDINVGGTVNLFECVRTLRENADDGGGLF